METNPRPNPWNSQILLEYALACIVNHGVISVDSTRKIVKPSINASLFKFLKPLIILSLLVLFAVVGMPPHVWLVVVFMFLCVASLVTMALLTSLSAFSTLLAILFYLMSLSYDETHCGGGVLATGVKIGWLLIAWRPSGGGSEPLSLRKKGRLRGASCVPALNFRQLNGIFEAEMVSELVLMDRSKTDGEINPDSSWHTGTQNLGSGSASGLRIALALESLKMMIQSH